VIGYDNATVRFIAAKDHVATGLTTEDKACPFKCVANLAAG
jgi:hypothetical protein